MTAAYPKVKTDLQVQESSVDGVVYYTVKEPLGGKFIRLREPEYFLLNSLDGSHSCHAAAEHFIKNYNKLITSEAVEQFVTRIGELGFLEGIAAAKQERSKSVLFIKLKAFNPERLLQWLYPKARWLFSPTAVVLQIAVIILGAIVFFANIGKFSFNLIALFRAADIITIIVSLFITTAVHEFAHALTCRHYGGSVREMGFLLLYFQPCFYCNLSDAYLFPNRRQRLLVTFAGVFFQMILWAVFTLLWRLTVEGYFLNRIFYLSAAVCFATLAFNLNPAIKLDGYYLLADYLQIPNLRQKAFNFIWSRIKVRLLGCQSEGATPTTREARIYWRYGVLSLGYSLLLICFLLYRGGELLIGKWGGTGFVLFAVLSLLIFKGLLSRWLHALASVWGERKRVWMKPKRIVIDVVIIIVVVLLGLLIQVRQTTGGSAHLMAAESYVVRRVAPNLLEGCYYRGGLLDRQSSQIFQLSASDYSVTQVQPRSSVGDIIHAGDTLLVINSTLNEGQLAETNSELKKTEAERRLLLSDPKVEEVAKKKSELKQSAAVYEAARKEFNRIKELHSKNLISDDDYERSVAQFNIASSAWDAKKSDLKLLKSAPKAEQIEQIDAEIEKLEARKKYLEDQLDASTIISPFTGVLIGTADPKDLFQLARIESLIVEIDLKESDLDILSPGAKMELRVSAFPATPHMGHILKFKLSPQLQAVAAIANDGQTLLPEMSGYAKVDCGKISLAGLTSRKISRFFRLEFWSWF